MLRSVKLTKSIKNPRTHDLNKYHAVLECGHVVVCDYDNTPAKQIKALVCQACERRAKGRA